MRLLPLGLFISIFALGACGAGGQDKDHSAERTTAKAAANGVGLKKLGTFQAPVYITSPPNSANRLFVVEQGGTIRIIRNGKKLSKPFLDITSKVKSGGEQGLLSVAFAPDYANSGKFYVYYTASSNGSNRVVEYKRATTERANPRSARVLISQSDSEDNHNGGQLQFGPDKKLYIGLGDGGGGGDEHGSRGNGQNLGTLLGKLLRIDPAPSGGKPYTIPSDNPFVDRAGARPEIYSYGLRNPWRFSFDRSSGDLAIGDVGQDSYEEIDYVTLAKASGANFGWRVYEGKHRFNSEEEAPDAIEPVYEYGREGGQCSITGGYVVRDPGVPALNGRYVYGDFCTGVIESIKLATGGASDNRGTGLRVSNLSSFGEDSKGRVYATSLDGPVYRLVGK